MPPTKPQLRLDMKARRAAMTTDQVARASDAIRQQLLGLDLAQRADSIFIYVSTRNEPDTHALIRDLLTAGKNISVPRIDPAGRMHAHRIRSLDDLIHNDPQQFNIPVPPPDAPIEPQPQITLVPGLAFTRTGLRLGMGRGHYDRYLAEHQKTTPIGLCYAWQILDHLPHEPHDRAMRMLVTEDVVIDCSALPA